jgi:hypothetical protein
MLVTLLTCRRTADWFDAPSRWPTGGRRRRLLGVLFGQWRMSLVIRFLSLGISQHHP